MDGIFLSCKMKVTLATLNPGRQTFSQPYSSTSGVNENVGYWIVVCALVFGLFVAWRVYRGLKRDRKKLKEKEDRVLRRG